MAYIKITNISADKIPDTIIPEVVLNVPIITQDDNKREILPITNISQLIMHFNSSASVAPTYSPRNFYEQIIIKDSGTITGLWAWSPTNGWKSTKLT